MKILFPVILKPGFNATLRAKCFELVEKVKEANPDVSVVVDESPAPPVALKTPWSKVCTVRNRLISGIELARYDYIVWVDSDVIEYPSDLPARLIAQNPEGISSPFPVIEDSGLFYDRAAFVLKGRDHIEPWNRKFWELKDRQLEHEPPYWPVEPESAVVEMDCVGTSVCVPTWIYLDGARHTDHPGFTDWYSLCKHCRDCGRRVTTDRTLKIVHANLPKYGESWH